MYVPCKVSKGFRDQEALVEIADFHGNPETMPLDRGFVVEIDGKSYLPVRVIHTNEQQKAALISLPVESDSGAHRIWVKTQGTLPIKEGDGMILSDREVGLANERGLIRVTDLPPLGDRRWSAHAIDLSLDAEIRVWEPPEESPGVEPPIFAPGEQGFRSDPVVFDYTTTATCDAGGFILRPHSFVLGWTVEKIKLPYESRIGARVEGKSSLARLGLGIHITAPTIHPGFGVKEDDPEFAGAAIRLEIWNIGVYRIRLTRGMAICQLLFEEVHGVPDAGYTGQFATQGPGAPPAASAKKRARKK